MPGAKSPLEACAGVAVVFPDLLVAPGTAVDATMTPKNKRIAPTLRAMTALSRLMASNAARTARTTVAITKLVLMKTSVPILTNAKKDVNGNRVPIGGSFFFDQTATNTARLSWHLELHSVVGYR